MDIEEDIEKLKKINNLLKFFKTHGWIPNLSREINIDGTTEAIDHILAEREEDKKRIEKLEKETKEILKKCWVMTTDHTLDEENIRLKEAITEVLNETMTSEERSRWGYEYFIKNKQYNGDLERNKSLLKEWSHILKGQGNRNYTYAYAIDRVLRELEERKNN